MEQNEQTQSEFLTILNDDCIYHVLKRLRLIDLCRMTHTCSKLRKSAQNEFLRSYPELISKPICFFEFFGELSIDPGEDYMEYFHKYIQSVKIQFFGHHDLKKNQSRYIASKCGKNVKKFVVFSDIDVSERMDCLKYSVWKDIFSVFSNIEHLKLKNVHCECESSILKILPRLKSLHLSNFLRIPIHCPKLEIFQYFEP